MQTYTFWQLAKQYKIEIPQLQRDYAQGREDDKTDELRDKFLTALIEALKKNKAIELDFVYGKVNNNVFIPIDGQQRLTTLFLIHCYIAQRTKKEELKTISFSYNTRISARDFCARLLQESISFEVASPSEVIEDASWFFKAWKKDPTVKSMLKMLDAIHEKMGKENLDDENLNIFWHSLIQENQQLENSNAKINALIQAIEDSDSEPIKAKLKEATAAPVISFKFLNLEEFELSDELYLKMNARGKALNDFEHFKANFNKWIIENKWEEAISEDITQTFSHKIDTIWTELFWKHRNSENKIDGALVKFIAEIAICNYAFTKEMHESIEQDLLKKHSSSIDDATIKKNKFELRISELIESPQKVNPRDFSTKTNYEFLYSILDIYANKENKYDEKHPNIVLWQHCNEKSSLFKELILESFTYKQRVIFYAQTEFFLNNNSELFSEWMRVIRNIVENIEINNANFLGAIELVKQLSVGSSNIYEFLSNNNISSKFASDQVKEEIIKAKLIEQNIEWKKHIFETEDHSLFRGCIRFLFNQDISTESLDIYKIELTVFKTRHANAVEIFDKDGIQPHYKKDAIFLRAFVSQFKNWAQLLKLIYDHKAETWRNIFKDELFREPLGRLLDNLSIDYLNELTTQDSYAKDKAKLVHEDLYKGLLLSGIIDGCKLNYFHSTDNWLLYPYNAKADWKKYLLGTLRNQLLLEAVNNKLISLNNTNQQLNVNSQKIPYLWGWNITFKYKNKDFLWKYNDFIYNWEKNEEKSFSKETIVDLIEFLDTF